MVLHAEFLNPKGDVPLFEKPGAPVRKYKVQTFMNLQKAEF